MNQAPVSTSAPTAPPKEAAGTSAAAVPSNATPAVGPQRHWSAAGLSGTRRMEPNPTGTIRRSSVTTSEPKDCSALSPPAGRHFPTLTGTADAGCIDEGLKDCSDWSLSSPERSPLADDSAAAKGGSAGDGSSRGGLRSRPAGLRFDGRRFATAPGRVELSRRSSDNTDDVVSGVDTVMIACASPSKPGNHAPPLPMEPVALLSMAATSPLKQIKIQPPSPSAKGMLAEAKSEPLKTPKQIIPGPSQAVTRAGAAESDAVDLCENAISTPAQRQLPSKKAPAPEPRSNGPTQDCPEAFSALPSPPTESSKPGPGNIGGISIVPFLS